MRVRIRATVPPPPRTMATPEAVPASAISLFTFCRRKRTPSSRSTSHWSELSLEATGCVRFRGNRSRAYVSRQFRLPALRLRGKRKLKSEGKLFPVRGGSVPLFRPQTRARSASRKRAAPGFERCKTQTCLPRFAQGPDRSAALRKPAETLVLAASVFANQPPYFMAFIGTKLT